MSSKVVRNSRVPIPNPQHFPLQFHSTNLNQPPLRSHRIQPPSLRLESPTHPTKPGHNPIFHATQAQIATQPSNPNFPVSTDSTQATHISQTRSPQFTQTRAPLPTTEHSFLLLTLSKQHYHNPALSLSFFLLCSAVSQPLSLSLSPLFCGLSTSCPYRHSTPTSNPL